MECSICCEKLNKSTHLAVICKGCDTSSTACRKCCQTYILSNMQDPMCMFCKSHWDRDFMNSFLTKKFVENDLKTYSENLFLERQISLLPETQKDALIEKKIINLTEKSHEAISELNRIKKKMYDQKEIIRAYNLEIYRLKSGTSTDQTLKSENFTIKCPSDNCNGFLDNKYYCNLCEIKFCRHCMMIKNEDHECDEDIKATVQAIKKDSKPCPGCGEMISKIDGCDQMWCIKCHIQFSWRTGVQIQGYNHNPEYFRWMRETGQTLTRNPYEPAEMLCGERFTDRTIYNIISNIFPNQKPVITYYQQLYMFYRHVQLTIGNRRTVAENTENNRELKILRVKFLLRTLTKEQWKKTLQQIDKKTKKNISYNNIWQLVQTVLHSYMEQIVTLKNCNGCKDEYLKLISESTKFRLYVNESFIKSSNIYGSTSCPGINESWREIYNYKRLIKQQTKRNQVLAAAARAVEHLGLRDGIEEGIEELD
jgi:hypothetical protein